ncbi:MAG: DUF3159 domain-containing protein [Caldilineales bacterium]|nr:DUF3159 domain-containing protein [Caldilineales bacterium]
MNKWHELVEEFRTVVLGRSKVIDAVTPPVLFVIVNALAGFDAAMAAALVLALLLGLRRWRRRESALFAFGGAAGAAVAFLLARWLDRAEGFFLPGIFTGGLSLLLAVASNLAGRPLVAWTSYLARRWPLQWYWHPQVRPAYSEITWLWALYFGVRLVAQAFFFQNAQADRLAWLNLALGWPATVLLLVVTYLYGVWRLQKLGGPSVEEFKAGTPPPWQGQRRGF